MKIFGIGLSKTGTTSLAKGLSMLGFKTKDYPGVTRYSAGDLASVDAELLNEYDALTDTPIPSLYRQLDEKFPDARFILTVRDREGWLRSCKKQFTNRLSEKEADAVKRLFNDLYGSFVYDEEKFSNGYDEFVSGVKAYFKGRPGKLLIMDVVGGDGWEKLCPFLGTAIPDVPFPKANVTQIRWIKVEDLVAIAREAGAPAARIHRAMAIGNRQGAGGAKTPFRTRLDAVYLQARGGLPFALARATRQACDILISRLSSMRKDIPVVTRMGPLPPYLERCKWNHLWLVDPLDGCESFGKSAGGVSINIALIEDRKPIYGVVYDPLSETMYYGVPGKGSFKVTGNSVPREMIAGAPGSLPVWSVTPASKALRLCLFAEGVAGIAPEVMDSMEWHCAAAHAILASVGKSLRSYPAGEELRYNKADLAEDCITVVSC